MLVIGHRGASDAFGDNTLAAFHGAVDQGADGVELDVRRTADDALALSHDPDLADGRVLVTLESHELPPQVTCLQPALDACAPLALVNIEIKNLPGEADFDPTERVADAVLELLDQRGELDDPRYLLSSFYMPTVERIRQVAPGVRTAFLPLLVEDAGRLIAEVAEGGHVAVHPHHFFVTEELVALAHDRGLAVNTWTCDEPDRIRWLAEVGVDAVVTNVPDVALAALNR